MHASIWCQERRAIDSLLAANTIPCDKWRLHMLAPVSCQPRHMGPGHVTLYHISQRIYTWSLDHVLYMLSFPLPDPLDVPSGCAVLQRWCSALARLSIGALGYLSALSGRVRNTWKLRMQRCCGVMSRPGVHEAQA